MRWIIFFFITIFILVSCQERSIRSIYKKPEKPYIDYIFYKKADSTLCELFNHLEDDYYIFISNLSSEFKSLHAGNSIDSWDLMYIKNYNQNEKLFHKYNSGKLKPLEALSLFAQLTNRYVVICNKHVVPLVFYLDLQHSYYSSRDTNWFLLRNLQNIINYQNSYFMAIDNDKYNPFFKKNWYFTQLEGRKTLIDYKYIDDKLNIINKTNNSIKVWPSKHLAENKNYFYFTPQDNLVIPPLDSVNFQLGGYRWEDKFEVTGKNRKDTLYYTYNEAFTDTPFVTKSIILDYYDLIKKNWRIELEAPY